MASRKKSTSTTDTSGSSSGSGSGSSSSSSGSGSSSSDNSDSSSCSPPARNSNENNSNKNNVKARRKSSDLPKGKTVQSEKSGKDKVEKSNSSMKVKDKEKESVKEKEKEKDKEKDKEKPKEKPKEKSHPPVKSKNNVYSSDDDSLPPPPRSSTSKPPPKKPNFDAKKKTSPVVKPKTSHPISNINKTTNISNRPTSSVGGKAAPSIVKQVKKAGTIKTPSIIKASFNQQKLHEKSKLKKKSIFSPDNSSESDEDIPPKHSKTNSNTSKAIAKSKIKENSNSNQQKDKIKTEKDKDKIVTRSSAESSIASSTASDSSSSSDSESESSADSSPPVKKNLQKKAIVKKDKIDNGVSESDSETKPAASLFRKLTRSSSTRKSKHLTGKAPSETDSDADSVKRSLSRSPVKKAPTVTKGKAKNKRTDVSKTPTNNSVQSTPVPEERKCPVEECSSLGHLGGSSDKHFTLESCPLFHNMSLSDIKQSLTERTKRDEERTKAIKAFELSKKMVTNDHKQYLMKMKEARAKFRPNSLTTNNNNKEHEPCLNGIVSDYDLQLFRDAQAIASENIENELKSLPGSKGTKYISMGKFCMEVWYQSPYPDDAARLPKLYICEFCLRYQKSDVGMKRHAAKCVWRHPPGDEIYRKSKIGVWQVDGKRHKQYCQHLCLLAKFFLDHKTLYYDVEPFLFYVMTLTDLEGCHTVGYFSKEKNSFLNYNVSCILTLPPYQRKGYGRLLIDFSYLLTRVEGKIGSPEKPLSDLGLISYRSYWKDVLLDYLCSRSGTTLSIKDVSAEMAINSYDIVSTLQALGMMKYWKGKHIILKKQDVLEEYAERRKLRGAVLKIDPTCLRWTPFIPPTPPGPS